MGDYPKHISHVSRVAADFVAGSPAGAITYTCGGLHGVEGCPTVGYVTIVGPGAVEYLAARGATASEWYGRKGGGAQREWSITVEGVALGVYEVAEVPAPSPVVPA
jgi:hypothetical protein